MFLLSALVRIRKVFRFYSCLCILSISLFHGVEYQYRGPVHAVGVAVVVKPVSCWTPVAMSASWCSGGRKLVQLVADTDPILPTYLPTYLPQSR